MVDVDSMEVVELTALTLPEAGEECINIAPICYTIEVYISRV